MKRFDKLSYTGTRERSLRNAFTTFTPRVITKSDSPPNPVPAKDLDFARYRSGDYRTVTGSEWAEG